MKGQETTTNIIWPNLISIFISQIFTIFLSFVGVVAWRWWRDRCATGKHIGRQCAKNSNSCQFKEKNRKSNPVFFSIVHLQICYLLHRFESSQTCPWNSISGIVHKIDTTTISSCVVDRKVMMMDRNGRFGCNNFCMQNGDFDTRCKSNKRLRLCKKESERKGKTKRLGLMESTDFSWNCPTKSYKQSLDEIATICTRKVALSWSIVFLTFALQSNMFVWKPCSCVESP